MPNGRMVKSRKTLYSLVAVLLAEAVLVLAFRWLGWYGTGDALALVSRLAIILLPLLIACVILIWNKFKFSLKSLLWATSLVAVFLFLSLMPLLRYRKARDVGFRLVSAKAAINQGMEAGFDWNEFYPQIALEPSPKVIAPVSQSIPPWLHPFAASIADIPADSAITSIWLNNDAQCRILASNHKDLPSLQSVCFSSGVSEKGFRLLQDVLPKIKHLESVQTSDVAPPTGWYASLTNIRTLFVWAESTAKGSPFSSVTLGEVLTLEDLEVFMVLGYSFNDNDARALATSSTIRRVILRGTAVTNAGEALLAKTDRFVYRN